MPNEAERPIEKLLRAAAKKRRDEAGAPFELHPATRRLLQGEAARQFARPQRQTRSFPSLLARVWPRVALSVAILAVLGVAVWTLVPGPAKKKQATFLAKNEEVPQVRQLRMPFPPTFPGSTGAPQPPVVAIPARPAALASPEATSPGAIKLIPQSPAAPQLLAKDHLAPATRQSLEENPPLGATLKPAYQPGLPQVRTPASPGSAAARPAEFANGAVQRRYGLAASSAPPARPRAAGVLASPETPSPATGLLAAANESASARLDKSAAAHNVHQPSTAPTLAGHPQSSTTVMDGFARFAAPALKEAQSVRAVQRFVQLATEGATKAGVADEAKAAQPVLANFEVEQAGRRLRITDGDGSVYTGYVQIPDAVRRARLLKAEAPAVALATGRGHAAPEEEVQSGYEAGGPMAQNYSFRVAGTNRSLKQKVVFTGSFVGPTNLVPLLPATTNLALGGSVGDARTDYALPAFPQLLNSRITGKVVIGSGKALEVNALPTAP